MSSELSSGSDLPGETGTGTDPDITPVPEHAGRDIGITRAELYNQLYGDHADSSGTAHGEATGDSSDSTDADGDDQPEAPGTGLEGQGTGTGTSQPGTDAGTAEGTGTRDDGNREGTDGGTGDTFGPGPDPAEPGSSAQDTGKDRSHGRAADGTAPPEGNQADSQGGKDTDGPGRDADRAADGQDAARARHPDRGSEDAGKTPRAETETAEPTARRADAAEGETTQASSADAPEPKQKDQPGEQNPAQDASLDQPGETTTEAQPDQHADEQRWTAIEQRIQEHEAKTTQLTQKIDDLEAENTQLRQKIDDLEVKLATGRPEQQPMHDRSPGVGTDAGNDAVLADTAAFDRRGDDEAGREGNRVSAKPERPGFSAESVGAGKEALGLAGTLGLLPSGLPLIMAGDSARRAFQEMPPEDQYAAINLADTAVKAFGSMSPGTAMALIGGSIIGPALHAKVRDIFHKMNGKD